MTSAITKINDTRTTRGWVGYDGDCPLCVGLARRFERTLRRRRFDVAPLQTPWLRERLGLPADDAPTEMRLLTLEDQVFGGADAVIEIARHVWWAWPVFAFAQMSAGRAILHAGYRWIAKRRNCLGGACRVRQRTTNLVFVYLASVYAWTALK